MHGSLYLHVRDVLEDEGLVELWVEVLPVHLGLVLGLLVWQQIDLIRENHSNALNYMESSCLAHLDEGICETGGPIGGREVGTLDHLGRESLSN